jgi:hypothetical protein
MQDEMGPKGLKVLAITHEPREQVLKLMAQMPPGEVTYSIGLSGGLSLTNPTNGIPYSWLVGVDGTVLWQGHGLPADKEIQAELKKVKVTDEFKAARAQKAIAYAENLLADHQLLRGVMVLEKVAKDYKGTPSAKTAEERKAAVEKDESLKAELAAQKTLDRLVGGLELPKDKLKKKEREAIAVKLQAFIKANEKDAPVAAEQAKMMTKVMTEDWADTAK